MARERLNKENHKEDIEKHAGDVGSRVPDEAEAAPPQATASGLTPTLGSRA